MRRVILALAVVLLAVAATREGPAQVRSPGKSHGEEGFPVNWKTYQDYEGMTKILKGLAKRFPDLATLYSTGKSRMGRELWVMEITNFAKGDTLEKPGFYIDGNIHGNEVNGMMVPLYSCWYLLTRYGHDDFVTDLVDRLVFYIRPSVNPDAMNSFITEPNTMHHPRWNHRPIDNDGDGLYDEDPEEDLNGDGEISLMRKRDPLGRWKVSPDDPRLLVPCKSGEPPGGWVLLGTEGIDNDGDGRINEDIPGGLDMARNFPYDYGVQNGWPYPLSEPETRGVIEFFRTHPNINGVFHYHNSGKLIMMALGKDARMESAPTGEGRRRGGPDLPPLSQEEKKLMEGFMNVTVERDRQRDLTMYQILAARGVQILKYRPTLNGGVGQFPPWTYAMYGAPSFLIELWGIPADYDGDGDVSEAEALRWVDEELHGEGWIPWKPFTHPQLGEIEIGGTYAKFVRRSPPARFLEEHCLANTRFHLYVASELPRLELTKADFVPICSFARAAKGGGAAGELVDLKLKEASAEKGVIGWLDVEIRNHGVVPTATAQAVNIKATRPDRLRVVPSSGIQVLGRSDPPNALGWITGFTTESPAEVEVGYLDGRSSKGYRFLVKVVRGKAGIITIEYNSQRGGVLRKTIPVRFAS